MTFNLKNLKLVFGKGEITSISKRTLKILQEIDDYLDCSCSNLEWFSSSDEAFKISNLPGIKTYSSSGVAFVGRNETIKISWFCNPPPKRKLRIPSLIFSQGKFRNWNSRYFVVIQPTVKTHTNKKTKKLIDEFISNFDRGRNNIDVRSGNLALYRDNIVFHDW